MTKIEELLKVALPKLILDGYWNILVLLEWRLSVDLDLLRNRQQEKRNFTISDITDFLSNELEKNASPFYQRICSQSISVAVFSASMFCCLNYFSRKARAKYGKAKG